MKRLITLLVCLLTLCSCSKDINVADGKYTGESFIVDYGNPDNNNYDTVFIGDSITVGLYDSADLGGARVLAKVGITTSGMYSMLSEAYGDILDENVNKAIINLGTNDVLINTNDTYKQLIDFVTEKSPKAQVFVALIHYPNQNSFYAQNNNKTTTDEKNEQLKELKGYKGAKLLDELQTPPFRDTLTDDTMTADDGLHLSDSAYKQWCYELKKNKIIK